MEAVNRYTYDVLTKRLPLHIGKSFYTQALTARLTIQMAKPLGGLHVALREIPLTGCVAHCSLQCMLMLGAFRCAIYSRPLLLLVSIVAVST